MLFNIGYQIRLIIYVWTVIGTAYGRVQFEDWHCGSSEFTRRMSYESITEHCEQIILAVNHCCVVHDVCYTHQLGQEECDEKFCECNRQAALARPDCLDILEASCSLVQLFGFGAYYSSINYTEPVDLIKHKLSSESLHELYNDIYKECPNTNATTSSCALQYNLCEASPIDCVESLVGCLQDTASMDDSASCRQVVTRLCDKALKEVNTLWNLLRSPRFMRSNTLKLAMGLSLVALLYSVLRWQRSRNDGEKSLKYSPV
ncbi:unnamed protein product [Nippostrongylus brasiliensis]|uniref:Uncharacterized protein n=1 Tax=Nippostrongylus brasiliensis TaxID=27835 RepID=A0A0N4XZK0_NIPBR|nr:unnamed protein product [Nippostrongylus brasiliensis]